MDTVYLVLYVELVRDLVDRGQAPTELVADLLQAPRHLGGVHRGVHGGVHRAAGIFFIVTALYRNHSYLCRSVCFSL